MKFQVKMNSYDIFISYNWDVKEKVKKLYKELTQNQNLKVWMDDYEIGPNRLVEELSYAISNSTIFLCCITKKYSESENCKDEIDYAKNLKKNIIVLMFERIPIAELGGVGFIIGPKVRFNCYKEPQIFDNWSGDLFNSIIEAVNDCLGSSNNTENEKDTLKMEEVLEQDESIISSSKQFYAVLQSDGNFVLYKSLTRKQPLWATNTWMIDNPKPFRLKLTDYGALILSDKEGNTVWNSDSGYKGSEGNYKLIIQNDGNMVIYDANNQPTWATCTSNTC